MNKLTPKEIQKLLARYLDGASTQEELRALSEYFSHADPLPAELKPYAQMFALLSRKPKTPTAEALDRFSRLPGKGKWRAALWPLLAAACVAAFLFVLRTPPETEESIAIAYVDGKMLTDRQAAMQIGQEALEEIFSNGNQEEQLNELFNGQ